MGDVVGHLGKWWCVCLVTMIMLIIMIHDSWSHMAYGPMSHLERRFTRMFACTHGLSSRVTGHTAARGKLAFKLAPPVEWKKSMSTKRKCPTCNASHDPKLSCLQAWLKDLRGVATSQKKKTRRGVVDTSQN